MLDRRKALHLNEDSCDRGTLPANRLGNGYSLLPRYSAGEGCLKKAVDWSAPATATWPQAANPSAASECYLADLQNHIVHYMFYLFAKCD
jgi:hypothetical protein